MEIESIDALIASHNFFRGLDEADLKLIAGCASNHRFDPGHYLAREGEPSNAFFAIRHGKVALETCVPQRGAVILQTVPEGEIVGWSWLFPPYRWQFSVRAVDLVRATVFDGACLRRKCDEKPALGYELLKRLAQIISRRLVVTRLQLMDIYGPVAQKPQ